MKLRFKITFPYSHALDGRRTSFEQVEEVDTNRSPSDALDKVLNDNAGIYLQLMRGERVTITLEPLKEGN